MMSMFSESAAIFLTSAIAVLGIVLIILNRGGSCCRKSNKNKHVYVPEAGNNSEVDNAGCARLRHNDPCVAILERDSDCDVNKHVYADVIRNRDSQKKMEEPNVGYIPMGVLKTREEDSSHAHAAENEVKQHLYVNALPTPDSS